MRSTLIAATAFLVASCTTIGVAAAASRHQPAVRVLTVGSAEAPRPLNRSANACGPVRDNPGASTVTPAPSSGTRVTFVVPRTTRVLAVTSTSLTVSTNTGSAPCPGDAVVLCNWAGCTPAPADLIARLFAALHHGWWPSTPGTAVLVASPN